MPNGRGGRRPNSGRKPKPLTEKQRQIVERVLSRIDEEAEWSKLAQQDEDLRLKFDVLRYLTDRRDGKAAQRVNIEAQPTVQLIIDL